MVMGGAGLAGSIAGGAVLADQEIDAAPMVLAAGASILIIVAGAVAYGTAAAGYRDEAERAAKTAEAERVRLEALERAVGIVRSKARTSTPTSTSTPAPVRVREPGREGMREPLVPIPGASDFR
jgi:hypothetical protein